MDSNPEPMEHECTTFFLMALAWHTIDFHDIIYILIYDVLPDDAIFIFNKIFDSNNLYSFQLERVSN